MQGFAPSVVTKQYEQASKAWKSMLEIGDNISILFFPFSDRVRRVEQFIDDIGKTKGLKYRRVFLPIDPQLINIEEKEDLLDYITAELLKKDIIPKKEPFEDIMVSLAGKNIQIVLTLFTAESILLPNNRMYLAAMYEVLHTYTPYIVSICCFETDCTNPHYTPIFQHYPQLLHNIYYYPFYGITDTTRFIRYLSAKWDMVLTEKQIDRIIAACGGKWWFVKEAVRQLRTQKDWSEDSEGMLYRKNMVIESFLPSERSALLKILTGRKTFDPEEQHSLHHLLKLHVITDDNRLTIPIIRKQLLASFGSAHALTYENNMVYLNHVPVGKFFSRKEIRALKTLVSKQGVLVTREELAAAIWPMDTEENYSNWAIDQIIARIRKRLPELEIPPASIKSIRGKGYMYVQL